MTYTFKCDNNKCNKTIICILTKYHEEYFGRCKYCHSGRLKTVENNNFLGVLREKHIIYPKNKKDY